MVAGTWLERAEWSQGHGWKERNGTIQGGVVNRGLFFVGPPPSPLGAMSRKISGNRWIAASASVNIAAGTGGPAVAVEIACLQDTTQSSAWNVKI
jgi:acetyl/propionyl-CoA carboxylase alpha subunit